MHYHALTTLRGSWVSRLSAMVVIFLAAVAGCDLPGKPDPANRPVVPDQIVDFGKLYAVNCAGCHGATGKLGPAPPLNDPLFVSIVPEDELVRVIRDGRAGTPMPAFSRTNGGSLSDAQVKVLVGGIKSHWKSDAPLERTPPSYALAKDDSLHATPEARERRMEIFQRACAGCHGPNGHGSERSRSKVGAIDEPAFLALISNQALRRIIITGRPDLGMPTYAEGRGRPADYDPLTTADIDNLVALLADWRVAERFVQTEQH